MPTSKTCDISSFFLKISILVLIICACTSILMGNTPIMDMGFPFVSDTRPVKGFRLFLFLLLRLLSDSSDTEAPEFM